MKTSAMVIRNEKLKKDKKRKILYKELIGYLSLLEFGHGN